MRAISPVIATVIIVSVAIAISIAVALWLTGITSGFTQTENLQIVSSYAEAGTFNYSSLLKAYIFISGSNTITIKSLTNGTAAQTFANGTSGWLLTIEIKNTGTTAATIDNIFINNIPINTVKGVIAYNGTKTTINSGDTVTLYILLEKGTNGYSPGQMVNVKIHTASGRDYPTTITLP